MLLLDEPMGGEPGRREDMARYVLDVNQERGVTVILIESTHYGRGHGYFRQGRGSRPRPVHRHGHAR